jgi:hypothetical protein
MRFYFDSTAQRTGIFLGGIAILAALLSYGTAGKRRPPETKNIRPASVALAAGSVETADHIDPADVFSERWTAVASETYRAAIAQRARPVERQQQSRPVEQQRPRSVEETSAASSTPSPAPQYPMAQATEDDIKQYLDERRAKAEKNSESKSRDDICRKGRTYFYRGHHQYWHCRR